MDQDIEARLAELAGLLREGELLHHRRADLSVRLKEQADRLQQLRAQHAAEVRDVDRLERMSLARVLVALNGSRDEALAREQVEVEAARYQVAEAESRLGALQAEHQAVSARLHALSDVPARHAAVLDEKDGCLRRSGSPQAGRLMELAELRGRADAELRELAEAAVAADAALGALGEVRRRLDEVSRLQAADNLLGGAVALARPDRLDALGWAAAHADRCLAVLHTELAEVGLARPFGSARAVVAPIGVTGGLFEQAFLSNLTARDRITNARRSVDRSARLVLDVRRELTGRIAVVEDRRAAGARERTKIRTVQ